MGEGENKMLIIKDIEIIDGKADTIHSALNNEIEKCGRIASLSRFWSDGGRVICWTEESCLTIKKG